MHAVPATVHVSFCVAAGAAGMRMQGIMCKCDKSNQFYLAFFNPTCLLYRYLCGAAGAGEISMADVSQVYNEVVRELSLNLALHEAAAQHAAGDGRVPGCCPKGRQPWLNIQAAIDRWASGNDATVHNVKCTDLDGSWTPWLNIQATIDR
jgi:hypothetical protein